MRKLGKTSEWELKTCLDSAGASPEERIITEKWLKNDVHFLDNPWNYTEESGFPLDMISALRLERERLVEALSILL